VKHGESEPGMTIRVGNLLDEKLSELRVAKDEVEDMSETCYKISKSLS